MKVIEIESLFLKIMPSQRLLSSVSLSLHANQSCALMGPSGSGKTTLALTLLGLHLPYVTLHGKVEVFGEDVLNPTRLKSAVSSQKKVSMIFQDPARALHPFFSVKSHFIHVLASLKINDHKKRREIIEKSLLEVGLEPSSLFLSSYPHTLSGGEKQRILIALALLGNPQLLIADEPTASLDFVVKVEILKLIANIREKRGLSLLLITHNPMIAKKMADQVLVIEQEKIRPA